jgi:AmmeMemoRadiSam system protein B
MHKCQHQTIFYPSDKTLLDKACSPRQPLEQLSGLPAAILVPHASYAWSSELLHRGFSAASRLDPDLVVVIGSLHQDPLVADRPRFVFSQSGDGIELPNGAVRFAADTRDRLAAQFPSALAIEDSYFSEEPCIELTLPMAKAYFPDVPVLPLLVGKPDARGTKTLSAMFGKVAGMAARPLFVLSANLTAILPGPVALAHARELVSLLEDGTEPLLEHGHRGKISSCGIPSLEALRTQSWGTGNWHFLEFQGRDIRCNVLPDTVQEKEKMVWHCVALRGVR